MRMGGCSLVYVPKNLRGNKGQWQGQGIGRKETRYQRKLCKFLFIEKSLERTRRRV